MKHYVSIIERNNQRLLSFTRYLAVDGYFMKKTFIDPVLCSGLQMVNRMRPDANLQYVYTGPKKRPGQETHQWGLSKTEVIGHTGN